jgi:DNA (cytosine-5)-methyltransferase 1
MLDRVSRVPLAPVGIGSHRLNPPNFIAVDLFCGAGGTTRGLLDAGGYVIAGIDKDASCEPTYVSNNQNTTLDRRPPYFLARDIFPKTKSHPTGQQQRLIRELCDLIGRYKRMAPRTPLMFAICAPCQPFTTLARKELSHKRVERRRRDRNLLSEALRVVREFRPDVVLSENVAGIADPKFGTIWKDFIRGLRRAGYSVGARVVCASEFGVPQYRRRSLLVACLRTSLKRPFSVTSEIEIPHQDTNSRVLTVAQAIAHLPAIKAGQLHPQVPNHRARTLSDTNLRRIAAARPGENNAYLSRTPDGDLSLPCHRRVKARLKTRCFTDVYTRMRGDRPSPTITTKCHSISNGRFGHYDVRQKRGISLREAAALQSFADDYIFHPSDAVESVARMIGNAVPPRLARFFANHAIGLLKSRSSRRVLRSDRRTARG